MKSKTLKNLYIEFISLMSFMVFVVGSIYVDVVLLGNQLSELSVTEFSQSTLVFLSTLLFANKITKEPDSRGLFILVSCFFTMIFLREADFYFDFIYHGFWKIPVLITLCAGLFYAFKNKTTIFPPLISYQTGKALTYTLIGVLITIVFSRLFGTRSLWIEITAENTGFIKTVVQEGLELLGYCLIFIGSVTVNFEQYKPNKDIESK